MIEELYTKRNKRYHIWGNIDYSLDVMKAGTHRLIYCPEDGHRRYLYDVKPDRARFIAAANEAQWAMEKDILNKARSSPVNHNGVPWTAEQLQLIEKFKLDMAKTGAGIPTYWTNSTAYEIAKAGVDAVIANLTLDES